MRHRTLLAVVALSAAIGCSDGSSEDDIEAASTATAATADATTVTASTATTAPTESEPSPATASPRAGQPVGFTTAQAIITSAAGEVCEVCVWLADEAPERARGLMEVTDLGPAAGMVFAYDDDTDGSFFMFNTPTPLSIAWFARDGAYLAQSDMEPCLTDDSVTCARFNPGGPFAFALEVLQGDLADLGVGPGSTLQLVPGSEALNCPGAG